MVDGKHLIEIDGDFRLINTPGLLERVLMVLNATDYYFSSYSITYTIICELKAYNLYALSDILGDKSIEHIIARNKEVIEDS